jgi:hypothetical protein
MQTCTQDDECDDRFDSYDETRVANRSHTVTSRGYEAIRRLRGNIVVPTIEPTKNMNESAPSGASPQGSRWERTGTS